MQGSNEKWQSSHGVETVGARRPVRVDLLACAAGLLLFAAACAGGTEQAQETAAAPEAAQPEAAASEGDSAPRVFFVEPQDGASVQSPVHLVFGAENFVIEPVGDGTVHEGAGHLHVGVDTDCLPAGEVIPKADPWVHFGDGQMEFDLQLTPGEHKLALQVGDGEHRTLDEPGLCQVITITVTEAGS